MSAFWAYDNKNEILSSWTQQKERKTENDRHGGERKEKKKLLRVFHKNLWHPHTHFLRKEREKNCIYFISSTALHLLA